MLESSDIMNRFASIHNIDVSKLEVYQFFSSQNSPETPSMMSRYVKLVHYAIEKEGGYEQFKALGI